jgi:hypothetical protein
MRPLTHTLATIFFLSTAAAVAQQPQFTHASLTTRSADHGLASEIDAIKREDVTVWVGYTIPVAPNFSSGTNAPRTTYLEGNHSQYGGDDTNTRGASFDHAILLLRIADHAVGKIRIDNPDRQLDAGDLRVIWLNNVNPQQSIATLKQLALQNDTKKLRDSAVFAISIHRSDATVPTLTSLAAPTNDLELREKAAFWLANQHGHDGFVALQNFAQKDADPAFREKLTFDLTLTKDPDAIKELIRMAHDDAAPRVRKQAQFWMATKGGQLVAGDLRNLAENDPDTKLRKSAVFALSRLPGDEAATQLIQVASSSKDPAVRKQAVFWLGQSSDPRALDYLTKLLQQ